MGDPSGYVVLLPVKPPASGKSRLVGLGEERRRALAVAFALDTAAACLTAEQVGSVLAVTDDVSLARRLADIGCATTPEGPTGGLNTVLHHGAMQALRHWPRLTPVAVCADLPALLPEDLDAALSAAPTNRTWFVADADGTGTTTYGAPVSGFAPLFGVNSRTAHLRAGAEEVRGSLTTLRRDVDDLDDLWSAVELGVGPATAALVADLPAPHA